MFGIVVTRLNNLFTKITGEQEESSFEDHLVVILSFVAMMISFASVFLNIFFKLHPVMVYTPIVGGLFFGTVRSLLFLLSRSKWVSFGSLFEICKVSSRIGSSDYGCGSGIGSLKKKLTNIRFRPFKILIVGGVF